jgi:hypothetical protein
MLPNARPRLELDEGFRNGDIVLTPELLLTLSATGEPSSLYETEAIPFLSITCRYTSNTGVIQLGSIDPVQELWEYRLVSRRLFSTEERRFL